MFEKDIFIDTLFQQYPIMFDIFKWIAQQPLIFSDYFNIIQSLMVTIIGEWNIKSESDEKLLEKTQKILSILEQSRLIIPPFTVISEILSKLSPQEIKNILLQIWHFINNYPPIASQYSVQDGVFIRKLPQNVDLHSYLESTKDALYKHIEELGPHIYSRF